MSIGRDGLNTMKETFQVDATVQIKRFSFISVLIYLLKAEGFFSDHAFYSACCKFVFLFVLTYLCLSEQLFQHNWLKS